jgi:23S rRNA pseudouridine2605 synthase
VEPIRIQKWLSMMGVASRREAESWIRGRRITVNGEVLTELGHKVDPDQDEILVDGSPVGSQLPPRVYWMLNKPDHVVTSRKGDGLETIYDLPVFADMPFLVSPVGRLDYRTEGLLLLTNDGELANRLAHPKFEVPRIYRVQVAGKLSPADLERVARREVVFDDGPCPKIQIKLVESQFEATRNNWYEVKVYEGRNRLVRRLFEELGFAIRRLIRVGFGPMTLPRDLRAGDYRQLKRGEIAELKKITQRRELQDGNH